MACKSYNSDYSTYKQPIHTNKNCSNGFPQNPLKNDMQEDIALTTTLKLSILQEPSKKQAKLAKTGSPEVRRSRRRTLIPPISSSFSAE